MLLLRKENKLNDFLLSSCNGLVLLVTPSDDETQRRFGFDYLVYNPILAPDYFVKIPHSNGIPLGGKDLLDECMCFGFGFGYLSSTEDYYIVAVNFPGDLIANFNIYSVRSKEWKVNSLHLSSLNSDLPLLFQRFWTRNSAVLIKETLYWGIKQDKDHQFILGYDLASMNYSIMPYPVKFTETEGKIRELGLFPLNNRLCAWAQDDGYLVHFWLWNPPLWTPLLTIQADFPFRKVLGLKLNRKRLLVFGDDGNLHLSDLHNNNMWRLPSHRAKNLVNIVPSLESVVAMTMEPNGA